MNGEIEVRLEDGRVFSGKIGEIKITSSQAYENYSTALGRYGQIPTFQEVSIEATIIGPIFHGLRDVKKSKKKKASDPLPLEQLKRAITFED